MDDKRLRESGGHALSRSRALSVPSRVEILGILRASPSPLTAQEIASQCGLHASTVQQHLVVLASAGLVDSDARSQPGRGRPKREYRAVQDGNAHLDLNRILVSAIDDPETARGIGHRHGSSLEQSPQGPVDTLRREAERMGFDPSVSHDSDGKVRIMLHNCPIADVAAENASVICSLHRGIAEGVLSADGTMRLTKFVARDPAVAGCSLVLGSAEEAGRS